MNQCSSYRYTFAVGRQKGYPDDDGCNLLAQRALTCLALCSAVLASNIDSALMGKRHSQAQSSQEQIRPFGKHKAQRLTAKRAAAICSIGYALPSI